jgi:hypothetical protein
MKGKNAREEGDMSTRQAEMHGERGTPGWSPSRWGARARRTGKTTECCCGAVAGAVKRTRQFASNRTRPHRVRS